MGRGTIYTSVFPVSGLGLTDLILTGCAHSGLQMPTTTTHSPFVYAPAPLSAAEEQCIVPNRPPSKASPLHRFALKLDLSYLRALHAFLPPHPHHSPSLHLSPAASEVKKIKVLTDSREPLDFSCCSMRKQTQPCVMSEG